MLTTVEAEVDVNGAVTLLEPLRLNKKSRAILTLLESERALLTEEETQLAEVRFARWIGAASLGYPTGADNESIDADLAREYGRGLDGDE
ncbi:MAG: hypothetical protein HOP19_09455 [Acidobacteria bacterium]|nr:hypothetical protein [Acidobacteriota bacterium]